MPSYIIKTAPDVDEYVWWSDIVEAPCAIGDRDWLQAYIRRLGSVDEGADDRFDRAVDTGSSAMWPSSSDPIYGWTHPGFIVEQRGYLRRENLSDFTRQYQMQADSCYLLLEPFEDAPNKCPYCRIDGDHSDECIVLEAQSK